MTSLSTRRFLLTATLGGLAARLAALVPLLGIWRTARAPLAVTTYGLADPAVLTAALAAAFPAIRLSAAIGTACLAALPANEASPTTLVRALLGETPGERDTFASPRTSFGQAPDGRSIPVSAGALAQSIRQRSREDFRDGRIVTVDGWMLSLTETRLHALIALPPPAGRRTG